MDAHITEAVLGLALAVLAWFVKTKLGGYDRKHTKHFEEIGRITSDVSSLEQRLEDHERTDRERYNHIESMFREIRSNITDMMKTLNSNNRRGY